MSSAGTAFLPEEPSLWRDYEGRENARDRGVLARSNRTVTLGPGDSSGKKKKTNGPPPPPPAAESGDLVYALDVEV